MDKIIKVIPERLGYQGINGGVNYEWALHVCLATEDGSEPMERVDKLYTEFYYDLGWDKYANKYGVPVIYEGRVIAYPSKQEVKQ